MMAQKFTMTIIAIFDASLYYTYYIIIQRIAVYYTVLLTKQLAKALGVASFNYGCVFKYTKIFCHEFLPVEACLK